LLLIDISQPAIIAHDVTLAIAESTSITTNIAELLDITPSVGSV
jgi:hypothetical protein